MNAVRAWLRALWYRLFSDPEPYPTDAAGCTCPKCDTGDDTMAVADAVAEHQRAEPWTGGPVGVAYTGSGRLSAGWIAYAEEQFDWTAAEADVRKRVR